MTNVDEALRTVNDLLPGGIASVDITTTGVTGRSRAGISATVETNAISIPSIPPGPVGPIADDDKEKLIEKFKVGLESLCREGGNQLGRVAFDGEVFTFEVIKGGEIIGICNFDMEKQEVSIHTPTVSVAAGASGIHIEKKT